MGNLNFDATNVAPATPFTPLPDAWYDMVIIEAEMAPSETAGEMLKLRLEIDEQKHPALHGRSVFDRLYLNHPTSQQAREIAQRTLSAICHAIGKLQIVDTDQLLGQRVKVKVKAVPQRTDPKTGKTYDASNEVKGYKPVDEAVAQEPSTPNTAAPAAGGTPAAKPATPSWKK